MPSAIEITRPPVRTSVRRQRHIPLLGNMLVTCRLVAVLFALTSVACAGDPLRPLAITPTAIPVAPTPTRAQPTTPPATRPAPITSSWWPAGLALPAPASLASDGKTQIVWNTTNMDTDGIRDFVLGKARANGYTAYPIVLSQGAIYDLLFAKSGEAYLLNITRGTDLTVLTARRVGTLHVEISGAVQLVLDLPLRERLDLTPANETAIGTSIPNPQCEGCEYLIYVHIAPFSGPGVYQTKPAGTYLIDAQVVPGGLEGRDDYRWAQQCTIIVKDTQRGDLACAGLEKIDDNTKRINLMGSWQQP